MLFRSFRSVRQINLIGAEMYMGQTFKGVRQTPSFLQESNAFNFPGWTTNWVNMISDSFLISPDSSPVSDIKNKDQLGEYLHLLYSMCAKTYELPGFLMNVGGDHAIGSATVSAAVSQFPGNLGVIWVDAQANCSTPEISQTKNYHGMSLGHVLGLFRESNAFYWLNHTISSRSVVLIGVRDLDPDEKLLIDIKRIKHFTMDDVRQKGIQTVMDETLAYLGNKKLHVSLDVNGIDPELIPGTATPFKDGLMLNDVSHIIQRCKEKGDDFVSMDLAEINFDIEKEKTFENLQKVIKNIFE